MADGLQPADLGFGLGFALQGPVVAEVDLPEDVWEVLLHPGQRGLPDAVLARGDHHQVAAAAQALQAVVRSCAAPRTDESSEVGVICVLPLFLWPLISDACGPLCTVGRTVAQARAARAQVGSQVLMCRWQALAAFYTHPSRLTGHSVNHTD